MNFSGQTGLVEIPDARTIPSDEVLIHGNNDFLAEDRQLGNARNYILGYSLLPGLELSGRVATAKDAMGAQIRNDLSGNAKWRFLDTRHIDLAVGIQDFAGDAQNFEARYGVGTAELGPLDLTLGYGVGPDRLDGPFGGVALNVGEWGRIAVDHDGDSVRAGIGLRYQVLDRVEAELATKLYSEEADEDVSVGLSLRFALGKPAPVIDSPRVELPQPAAVTASAGQMRRGPHAQPQSAQPQSAPELAANDTRDRNADAIADGLADAGLSRVRVGEDAAGQTVVKFENRRFWHSQLDGFQVVHQVLRRLDVDADNGWVLLEEKNGVPRSSAVLDEDLRLRHSALGAQDADDVDWLTEESSTPFGVELRLEPRIDSLVATDFGVFDYDVALQSTLSVLLGHGLSLHGAGVVEGFRSDVYDDGGAFENRQQESGLDEAFLQWTHRPFSPYVGRVSGGIQKLGETDFTVLDYEGALHSPTGAHQLHAHIAHFDNQDFDDNRDMAIGSYRFWWWDRDLSVTLSAGRFFDEQLAGRVILRRYIGDVIVGLFYARDEDDQQSGGLSVSFPLTPRVGMEPIGGAYVVGQPRWQYAASTTIDGPEGRNVLRPNFLSEPDPNFNLRRDFLDSDRALPGYIESHWRRGIYGDQIDSGKR